MTVLIGLFLVLGGLGGLVCGLCEIAGAAEEAGKREKRAAEIPAGTPAGKSVTRGVFVRVRC